MKSNYQFRRGRSGDNNHWYSSTYWRSNQPKQNCGPSPPHHSTQEKEFDNLNVIESNGYSFRPNVRSNSETNSRLDSRQSVKRSNNCIEETANQKRLRIADPFESPNSLVKDFRLTNGCNSADSAANDLFCQTCQMECHSALDYSNHLSGRRHKINLEAVNRRDRIQTVDRHKPSDDCNLFHRLLKHSKEKVIGLDYIKETRQEFFSCYLCKCHEMSVHNTFQHIRGYRHQRNFMAQKNSEDRRKRSTERQKRQVENRSISSATQTCDNSYEELTSNARRSALNATPKPSSSRGRAQNEIIPETDFENLDSCEKTIENFRNIRKICDHMIGYFSEKQKTANMSPKNMSSTGKTCLVSKIKTEN